MRANEFAGMTGFQPDQWQGRSPIWAEQSGFAEAFEGGVGVPVQDLMQDRALLLFPVENMPNGFPSGMSIGRALLEARSEFLREPFVAGSPYHLGGDELAVVVALTSVGELSQAGRPTTPLSQEDFYWLCNHLHVLADIDPLLSEEGESEVGKGGSVYRSYQCAIDVADDDERRRLCRIFMPMGTKIPVLIGDHRLRAQGLWVINSATHGIGLVDPGEPYWQFLDDPALPGVSILAPDQLGLPDYPLLADFGGEPARFCWLPLTEQAPRFMLRLEVVLPGHPRHRAKALAGLDPETRAHAPEALVAVFVEYQSPLVQRCRGIGGIAMGGTSVLAQYGLAEREEIQSMASVSPHRMLEKTTKAAFRMAKTAGLI